MPLNNLRVVQGDRISTREEQACLKGQLKSFSCTSRPEKVKWDLKGRIATPTCKPHKQFPSLRFSSVHDICHAKFWVSQNGLAVTRRVVTPVFRRKRERELWWAVLRDRDSALCLSGKKFPDAAQQEHLLKTEERAQLVWGLSAYRDLRETYRSAEANGMKMQISKILSLYC